MGQNSVIEWTDHTFNPWWGCVRVSPGCQNCYAESLARRYGHDVWGVQTNRRFLSDNHWKQPLKWNQRALQQGLRMRVFCASMADVFEDNEVLNAPRHRLWQLIDATPVLDWLILTKRPENMLRLAPWKGIWPSNVWAMTTVENQHSAEKRIPHLIEVPSDVRGLSVEPLLGKVDLSTWLEHLQWVIVGGESGGNSRPMDPKWVRFVRDQCLEANVPFFFKQWGNWVPADENSSQESKMTRVKKKAAGRLLDGTSWNQVPQNSDYAFVAD
jgi:protein gp37